MMTDKPKRPYRQGLTARLNLRLTPANKAKLKRLAAPQTVEAWFNAWIEAQPEPE